MKVQEVWCHLQHALDRAYLALSGADLVAAAALVQRLDLRCANLAAPFLITFLLTVHIRPIKSLL